MSANRHDRLDTSAARNIQRLGGSNRPYHGSEGRLAAWTVAPLVAGIDKFFHWLVNWDQYLAPAIARTSPVPAHTFMLGVGIIEMIAGVLVAVAPRIGGWIVAAWLFGIIVNLLMIPAYLDIALRDFGLALGAIALARLAEDHT